MRPPSSAALAWLLLAVTGSAQETVPGAKTELVRLDAVVTDAQGRLIRDLRLEDFEVLEDGKPQRVVQFVVSGRLPAAAGAPERAATPAAGLPADASAPSGRHVVIVVDDLHIAHDNLVRTKEALRQLVDEVLAPDDNVAVLATSATHTLQQFTRDRAVVKAAILGLSVGQAHVAPARGSQMTPAQAELILSRDRTALELAARTMVAEPGSVFDGASPRVALESPGGVQAGPGGAGADSEAKLRVAEQEVQRQAQAVLAEALRFSTGTLRAIEDVLHSLAPLPGRKLCLLVSNGFLLGTGTSEERREDLRRIADAATRSGAVVYALDSRGLVPSGGGDASVAGSGVTPGLQARVERQTEQLLRTTLETLARETGGFVVRGTNDLAAGLRRMLKDNDTYYLIAYEPTSTRRDGRFRKIEVRLPHRPGLTVRTRRGYFAPDDRRPSQMAARPPVTAAVPLDAAPFTALLEAPIPAGGIPVRLTVDYLELPPNGAQAVVRAHVDVTRLRWQQAGGRHRASLELVGGVYDTAGRAVGAPFGRRAELDLTRAEQERLVEAGLYYQQLVPLAPGRYEVRLIAHERELAQKGGAAQWVEVPDLQDGKLAMSAVFLSSSTPPPAGAPAGETIRDAHTLRRFARGGGLYFQFYVYNPRLDDKGTSDLVLQAQIWSAGKVIAASKPQPAAMQRKDGMPLPETNGMSLEGLAPGAYELRVVVVDRKANATATRRVDFTLE